MPSDIELAKLLDDRTRARIPANSDMTLEEFRRAFYACGRLGRLPEPSTDRYFVSSLDDANMILRSTVSPTSTETCCSRPCLAWGDVPWRASDKAMGQSLELALAKPNTGTPARPVWRDILAGRADVLPPLPPRGMRSSRVVPNTTRENLSKKARTARCTKPIRSRRYGFNDLRRCVATSRDVGRHNHLTPRGEPARIFSSSPSSLSQCAGHAASRWKSGGAGVSPSGPGVALPFP